MNSLIAPDYWRLRQQVSNEPVSTALVDMVLDRFKVDAVKVCGDTIRIVNIFHRNYSKTTRPVNVIETLTDHFS